MMDKPDRRNDRCKDRAEEMAAKIKFDRGPQHHDHTKRYFYCVECKRCDECSELEIASALRAYRNEALEEAAETAHKIMHKDSESTECEKVRLAILALKTEPGGTRG